MSKSIKHQHEPVIDDTKTLRQLVKEYIALKEMAERSMSGQAKNDFLNDLDNRKFKEQL